MSNLIVIILVVVAFIFFFAFLIYLIKDTVRYNKRESLRTLKLQKLEYWHKTGDEQMIKEIDEIDRQMEEI